MDFKSIRFSLWAYSLSFALSLWGIQPAWALESLYERSDRTIFTAFPSASSSTASAGAAPSVRYSAAAAAAAAAPTPDFSSSSSKSPHKQAERVKMPAIARLSLCGVRGYSSPDPAKLAAKKKKSAIHQAREEVGGSKKQYDFPPSAVTAVVKLKPLVPALPIYLALAPLPSLSNNSIRTYGGAGGEVVIYPPLPRLPLEREVMFVQPDQEGHRLRMVLTTLDGLQGFNYPVSFLRPEERHTLRNFRSEEYVFHIDIMELVIEYVYGGCLGKDAITHGEDRGTLLRRLIDQRCPRGIRFQLSRHETGDPHAREENCHFGPSDIARKAVGSFNPETDPLLREITGAAPDFIHDVRRLTETWRFFRPSRLFKTIGEILYRGVQDAVTNRGYWMEQTEVISLFSINFCLLARRYDCARAYPLAVKVYKQLEKYYNRRILRGGLPRNPWVEVLLQEMERFLSDPRLWVGEWLDFDIETAK